MGCNFILQFIFSKKISNVLCKASFWEAIEYNFMLKTSLDKLIV